MSLNIYDIFKSHVITEKSNRLESLENGKKYTFIVNKQVGKKEVKNAFEIVFETKVSKVNIINYQPTTRVFKGCKGKLSGFKKVIVTLDDNYPIKNLAGI